MSNLNNFGSVTGNLTSDPRVRENRDGSKTVFVTVAANDNFKSGPDKSYGTQFVELERWLKPSDDLGVFGLMRKGALWSIGYSVRSDNYVGDDGQKHYVQRLRIEEAQLLGPKPGRREAPAREDGPAYEDIPF